MIGDLKGDIDPRRYESCGGDMVLMREHSLAPIVTFLEAELFFARVIAAIVWRRWVGNLTAIRNANAALEQSMCASIRANTESFLNATSQPGALTSLLSLNAAGGPWSKRDATARMETPAINEDATADLTGREREVLGLIIEGMSNKQISSQLGMGLSTVKKHMGRILDKYGVQSRTELVTAVLRS